METWRLAVLVGVVLCAAACFKPDVLIRADGQVVEALVVDVEGDGVDLVDASAGVVLNLDENLKGPVGWTRRGSDDAFLLLAWPGAPVGARDVLGFKAGPSNGFDYLMATLRDTNMGGHHEPGGAKATFESSQPWFDRLVLWTDRNQDATVQEDELTGFRYAGFMSIDVPGSRSMEIHPSGNQVVQRGAAVRMLSGVPRMVDIVAVRLATR